MSNNLGLTLVSEGQDSGVEDTINDMPLAVSDALTEVISKSLASGNVALTNAEYRGAIKIIGTGLVAAQNLTLPTIKRLVLIESDAGNADTLSIVVGTTSIDLAAGEARLFYTDGTTNGLKSYLLGTAAANPYDLAAFIGGVSTNSEIVMRFEAVRAFTLPVSLTGSKASAGVAATGTASYSIKNNGSSIGSVAWSASGTVGAFTFASAVTFAAGDILTITAPSSADATLADIAITFMGTR